MSSTKCKFLDCSFNTSICNYSIKDTGTGIDPEISPRLYSKFATKSHKGTGLGLHISKNIIKAHGGRIYASNNYDKCRTLKVVFIACYF